MRKTASWASISSPKEKFSSSPDGKTTAQLPNEGVSSIGAPSGVTPRTLTRWPQLPQCLRSPEGERGGAEERGGASGRGAARQQDTDRLQRSGEESRHSAILPLAPIAHRMVQQLALRAVDRAHRFRHEGASRADFRAIGTETPTHRTLRTCLRTSRGSAPRRPAAAAPAPRRTREGQAPPLQLASRQGATHPRAALASPSTPSTQDTTNDASAAINSHDRSCSTTEV